MDRPNRKFLDDIGYNSYVEVDEDDSERIKKWDEEYETYGIDERNTWDMNLSMIEYLYEHMMMLRSKADHIIDWDAHEKITFEDEEMTLSEAMDKVIEMCKEIFFDQDMSTTKLWQLYALIADYMWW